MNLRLRLATLALVPLSLAGAAACSAGADSVTAGPTVQVSSAPGSSATDAPTSAAPAPDPNLSIAARVNKATKVHADHSDSSKVVTSLATTTPLGSKTTLMALDTSGDWVKVALPIRPNGATGWVKASDVDLRPNLVAVTVDRTAHKLVVTNDGQVVLQTDVAVGSAQNPTPAGSFFVTDLLDTGNAAGDYGPYAFGLSGHSDTLTEFAGGDGQIGVHGTNDPSSIGKSVSHGCVRVPNDTIKKMIDLVPLGTPITIS